MKKALLATSAIVAAGAMTMTSASAAERIQINVGGYMEQWVGFATNNDDVDATGFDVKSDTEIIFTGSTTLDNGIQFGVNVQLEGNNSADQIDESFLFIEGTFGRIIIGSENAAHYLMHYAVPDVGIGLDSGDHRLWVTNTVLPFQTMSTRNRSSSDDEKISYFTPRIAGFQLGVSYIPEDREDNGVMPANTNLENGISAAINFNRRFNDWTIRASVGGIHWLNDPNRGNPSADFENAWGISTGLGVGYGGFMVSFAYSYQKDFNAAAGAQRDSAHVWQAGIMYTSGPIGVSLAGMAIESDRTTGPGVAAGRNEDGQVIQGSLRYTLGPGIEARGSVFYANWESKNAGVQDNDGFGAVGGFRLTF